jgi:Zn finger protein HypA/HybF involved in hydrogenase expression
MIKCEKCAATGAIAYVPTGTPNGPQAETFPITVCPECGGHGTKLSYEEVRQLRNEENAAEYKRTHPTV